MIRLETKLDTMLIDNKSLKVMSFHRKGNCDMEWLDAKEEHPVFVVGVADEKKRYRWVTSFDAEVSKVDSCANQANAEYTFTKGLLAGVTFSLNISVDEDDDCFRFGLSVAGVADKKIIDVHYPFLVFKYDTGAAPDSETLILPHGYGSGRRIRHLNERLLGGSHKLRPDGWATWEMSDVNNDCDHYPGMQYAQFMAYYNDVCGVYLASDDQNAGVKRFRAVHRSPGVRLGVSHIGDWDTDRDLGYQVLLRSFVGDWYDAADIYKNWSKKQSWFVPLNERDDIPNWAIDSPTYIFVRPLGYLDVGDMSHVEAFYPYDKCLALLDKVAKAVDTPLSVVLTSWEKNGSWTYPDTFPPHGGEENMDNLVKGIKERGWRAGYYSSGTRWTVGHFWNGYDGRDYFDEHEGEKSVCRNLNGEMWEEDWDRSWRPSYACCMNAEGTIEFARDYVKHTSNWGMEHLQWLDQNNGASVFPCYSDEHGHPPAPGKWMQESLVKFTHMLRETARENGAEEPALSAESGLSECALPLFELTELRNFPEGYNAENIPLYHYLFHECILIHGAMGSSPEPYSLSTRNAANCVLGCIPGGVLADEGKLLDKDTFNWEEWEPYLENPDNYYAMIKNANALRRDEGKDFLVFGSMQRPPIVSEVSRLTWKDRRGKEHSYDAIFYSAWNTPDDKYGIVLANWTSEAQTCVVDSEKVSEGILYTYANGKTVNQVGKDGTVTITLPPNSCALYK